jgi:hypothetical protein
LTKTSNTQFNWRAVRQAGAKGRREGAEDREDDMARVMGVMKDMEKLLDARASKQFGVQLNYLKANQLPMLNFHFLKARSNWQGSFLNWMAINVFPKC